LPGEGERFVERNGTPLQFLGEVFTGDQLQNEEGLPVRLLEPIDRGDVGMVQGSERLRLSPKSCQALGNFYDGIGGRILTATSRWSFASRAR
jgi:hypothetical protein